MMTTKVAVLAVAGWLVLAGGIGPASAAGPTPAPAPATTSAPAPTPAPAPASTSVPLRRCLDAAVRGTSLAGCDAYASQIAAARKRMAQAGPARPVPGTPRFTG